ncbi:MAG: helix-turn-helix transcriptional regulator [Janthinobacterium lividum]
MTPPSLAVTPGMLVQVADYPPGATYGPRRLVDHEFVWVLKGSAVWTVHPAASDDAPGGSSSCRLRPGMIALARAGTVDSYHWDPHRTSTHAFVHFRVTELGHLGDDITWPATRSLLTSPILGGICSYLVELAGHESAEARRHSEELIRLLLDLFVSGPLDEPEDSLPGYLAATAGHVRSTWANDGLRILSATELATAAGVSEGHLFRLFRQDYGCGPARALELVRLARAAIALQRSNASLAEIAELTGFANPYHLSRRFAAVYRLPPGAFRRLQPGPDPLAPVREVGLLSLAHLLLTGSAVEWSPQSAS